MQRRNRSNRRRICLILSVLLIAVLAVTLSGCGREEQSLEGRYIATFELQGGTLETPTSSVSTKINFAYYPGTYVLDICELNGYKLFRNGYVFTGWYTDESCSPSSEWDFDKVIDQEQLTLYAGWKKAIQLTYTVCYIDENGQQVSLGKYDVNSGDKFEDWRNFAKNRNGYTALGYYSDPECKIAWDTAYTHPGNDTDLNVPVYVDYMKGKWTFVDTLSKLKNAISAGENVHLTADIDCAGETLSLGDYSGEINGNGFSISNFTVKKKGTAIVSCAIFNSLGDGTIIRDISFSGVTYDVTGVADSVNKMKVAALAVKMGNVTVSGVSIEGTLITNHLLATEVQMYYETTADNTVVTVNESSINVPIYVN